MNISAILVFIFSLKLSTSKSVILEPAEMTARRRLLSQLKLNETCCTCPFQSLGRLCGPQSTVWYYDSSVKECKEYYAYGGCWGSGNQFNSEEDCYAKCDEKLVPLSPPENITAVPALDAMHLWWHPPQTYLLHEPDPIEIAEVAGIAGTNSVFDSLPQANTSLLVNVLTNGNVGYNRSLSPGNDTNYPSLANTAGTSTQSSMLVYTVNVTQDTVSYKSEKPAENSITSSPVTSTVPNGNRKTWNKYKIEDFYGKNRVPFHFAKLFKYVVSYKKFTDTNWTNVTVSASSTYHKLENLATSTLYMFMISAVYITNTTMSSGSVNVSTGKLSAASNCQCDTAGTVNGTRECNMSVTMMPLCTCKPHYGGLFCEMCQNNFYRTGPTLPCHPCPCSNISSTGSCHFMEGYLHCTVCREGYSGNLCHRCANGYYRDPKLLHQQCQKCRGCYGISPTLICDPYTGTCLNCHFNTTGEKCDRCLDGFEGDPPNNISCTPISARQSSQLKSLPQPAVIAICVIAVIVLLSGIITVVVYRRMHNFPVIRPFWTVEFQEDHDKVNFSAVPADDFDQSQVDQNFYDTQTHSTKKLPPYFKLHEDF